MTNLHAALGVSQLGRLREYIDLRQALAARYDALLQGLPLHRLWFKLKLQPVFNYI